MVSFSHRDTGTAAQLWAQHGLEELPPIDLARVFDGATRLHVVAAHPDDETLGAGGLIHRALGMGLEVTVVVCTMGEGSHPDSTTHTPQQLATLREAELRAAMQALGESAAGPGNLHLRCPGLPDGKLASHEAELETLLGELIGEGPCVVASTYREDGHTDHEVLGRLVARLAAQASVTHLEFPIWYWNWAHPENDNRWTHWHRLELPQADHVAKETALAAHQSQVQPLSELPGDEVLLDRHVLEHFHRAQETFRVTWLGEKDAAVAALVFEDLYLQRGDPWDYRSSRYEQRKQDIVLASLPRAHYGAVLELGCSIGLQTAELAARSDRLVGVDASATAVAQALAQVADLAHVTLVQATLPGQWPPLEPDSMDLVVLSEIGYFLAADELAQTLRHSAEVLRPGGELLLCHWLHPIEGWPLDGQAVHRMAQALDWPRLLQHREQDFLLEVFQKPGGELA
ncbi:PIG-L family deacetylase [Glutamicibacter sp. PS]|uniref:PIG-L family deacetylase n=1 Tax=Glutamicibacter sp. PS TaxID=3075634 RepID=UPI0028447D43|nr:PIG-L family deacetylase [Glutamicibacter sp. PS]MDR4532948.1 bifunctional PIG-L family deacetylase/class I SAM-dependent methyltransferase [Glutamicibacter sp. PS]